MNSIRGRGDGAGNELAQRAVVFLMDARTARGAMIFRVRTYASNDSTARIGCVDDPDDTRQSCLHERASENQSADKS